MSEKQECSECGKPLAHRVHSPTYGTHAYREPVASPQATEPPINLSPVAEYWAEYHNRPIEEADTDELLFAHNWAQRGIGREDAGSPAERQQPSKLHNEGSSPSSPSNSNINIALHRAAQPAAGTTPPIESDLKDAVMFLRLVLTRKDMDKLNYLKPKIADWLKRRGYEGSILRETE